jgi:hypothetical protein
MPLGARRSIPVKTLIYALMLLATPATAYAETASQRATHQQALCFEREYRPNQDTSTDGGKSSLRLLTLCAKEWEAASAQCQKDYGDPEDICNEKTGLLAQAYILLREAKARGSGR